MICCDSFADGPPLLLTVCPVNVCFVDVPELFVTVRVTPYVPNCAYVWDICGAVTVSSRLPSPKFQV